MSARACDLYYPDPPVCDYEPEYSRPADMSYLDNYRAPKRRAFRLVPPASSLEAVETFELRPAWKPALIGGGARLKPPKPENRRDGTSAMIECAGVLEHTCYLFDREADTQAILDAEPHLRRAARALRRLTDQASRARRLKRPQESLKRPQESLFDE
jgi:hypothetical protein